MRSPWKKLQDMAPGTTYLVLASDIGPKHRSLTPKLFKGAGEVKRQIASASGVVGFSMIARPMRKQYMTLSVWESEEALSAFARSAAHGDLMRALGPEMAPSTFVRWQVDGGEGRPSWREAFRRLTAEADRAPRTARR